MKNFCLNSGRAAGLLATATTLLLTACAPGQDTPAPVINLNVASYLAVGDTYTAGISAGGLTRNSQEYSFPNQLAKQFQAFSGGAFTQPLIDGTGSGYLSFVDVTPVGYVRTRRVAGQAVRGTVISPSACIGPDTVRLLTRSATASTLPQNLGVPGLLLSQIATANLGNQSNATPATATSTRILSACCPPATNRTYLQAVTTAASSATFFTFFQGLDDFMPYIRSGGTCGSVGNVFVNQMKTNAKRVLDVLTAGGRPGIIAKLPDVTTLPLLSLGQGDKLQARLRVSFGDTASLYVVTPAGDGRHITGKDYVLATAISRIGQRTPVQVGGTTMMLPYGRDIRNPVRDADVLDADTEMTLLNAAVNNYNNADPRNTPGVTTVPGLEYLANQTYKLPVISTSTNESALNLNNSLFSQVDGLISVSGVQYSAEPVRGGFFSVDYYSLTPRGNGLLANAFITAINRAYRTNIPAIDVNKLPTSAQ